MKKLIILLLIPLVLLAGCVPPPVFDNIPATGAAEEAVVSADSADDAMNSDEDVPAESGEAVPPAVDLAGDPLPLVDVDGQEIDFGTADWTDADAGLLEELLAAWGFGYSDPDGKFLDDDVYELSLFQRWAGLKPTGQPDDATRQALHNAYDEHGEDLIERDALPLEGRYIGIDPMGQANSRLGAEALSPEQGSPQWLPSLMPTVGAGSDVADQQRNLDVALALRDSLEAKGARVYLTRDKADSDLSAVLRAKRMNVAGVAAVVLINCGKNPGCAAAQPGERGYQTGSVLADSQKLGRCLQAALAYDKSLTSRSLGTSNEVPGLNWAKSPVCLIEPGSLANQDDDQRLNDSAYRAALVTAVTDGFVDFFSTVAAG